MGEGEENWVGIWRGELEGGVAVTFVEFDRFYGRGRHLRRPERVR